MGAGVGMGDNTVRITSIRTSACSGCHDWTVDRVCFFELGASLANADGAALPSVYIALFGTVFWVQSAHLAGRSVAGLVGLVISVHTHRIKA